MCKVRIQDGRYKRYNARILLLGMRLRKYHQEFCLKQAGYTQINKKSRFIQSGGKINAKQSQDAI